MPCDVVWPEDGGGEVGHALLHASVHPCREGATSDEPCRVNLFSVLPCILGAISK